MNFKKIIFISILLLLLSVAAVSASDCDNNYFTESPVLGDSLEIQISEVSSDSSCLGDSLENKDCELLADSSGAFIDNQSEINKVAEGSHYGVSADSPGSFEDLQSEIINAPEGSVLNLTRDYNGHKGAVIHLSKDLTIDGKGHTLNGLGECIIFLSERGLITLKNLNLINGYNNDEKLSKSGGAINIAGPAQYTIENCIFSNNWANDFGGAIYNSANNPLTIKNSIFQSNEVDDWHGGAIYSVGKVYVENSSFENNIAYHDGGAICSDEISVIASVFKSNEAGMGGALCGHRQDIENSRFEENSASCGGVLAAGALNVDVNQTSPSYTTFFINNKAHVGGVMDLWGSANISNAYFFKNAATFARGGVINTNVAGPKVILNINNCGFRSNTANDFSSESYGGAIYAMGNIIATNSSFIDNYADGCGGGIFIDKYANNCSFENCIFDSNKADNYGGAIASTNGQFPIYIKDSQFNSNVADDHDGGAIYTVSSLFVDNSSFNNNLANDNGGAIYSKDIVLNNCLFQFNKAKDNGGAIFNNGDLNSTSSVFLNNEADDCGGAIYTSIANFKGSNNRLSYNSAGSEGGAIYAKSMVNLTDTELSYNSGLSGAAVFTKGTIKLVNSYNIFNNTVKFGPGSSRAAFYATRGITLENGSMSFNTGSCQGGAVYSEQDVNVTNFEFRGNNVSVNPFYQCCGGAIFAKGSVIANYTNFYSNYAEDYGGAIYSSNAELHHCLFESNNVKKNKGGAIYTENHLSVDNCTFNSNQAGEDGGAIYTDALNLLNTLSYFVNNVAYEKGGAIYTNRFDNDVKNACFIGNRAGLKADSTDDGGAIYINDENWISFENCYFANNHCSDEGGAIYLDTSSSKLSLINNIFLNNTAGDAGNDVFNCGKYVTVNNNWWGEDLPMFNNDLSIWYPGPIENRNHYDEDALRARLTLGTRTANVNSPVKVQISLISPYSEKIYPKLIGLENFIFESDHLGEFIDYYYGDNGLEAWYIPKEEGIHKITVKNLFNLGKEIVGSLNVNNSQFPIEEKQIIMNTVLSLTHLQKIINDAAEGSVIYLNNDFVFYGADIGLHNKEGVIIDKNIVIDGLGHSLDAKSMSGILQSITAYVTLRNIVFKNGYQENADDGGALRILGNAEYTVINCTFDSNKALQDGGAIYNEGGDLDVRDCTFINNRAEGANKLNDCDGGAIHSKSYTYIRNCVFKNNFANDNGGAIYVTGNLQISSLDPSYFESNIANKGKGGAIYANAFTTPVKYASFISNRAGDNALISDDGGAVYINDENDVTFDSCLFVNNHCSDEGGAIYLDDGDSHLTLTNNIFIGNSAGDEGQSVFNCGYYDLINNNFWGGNNPTQENDQLIKWRPLTVKNGHFTDADPLSMNLALDQIDCPVNTAFEGLVHFYKSNGALYTGDLTGLKHATWTASPNIDSLKKSYDKNTLYATFTPNKGGKYTITANLFGYSLSKSINVFDIQITADEVTTFTNVPVSFKIHLDGDKKYTANQKVRVSFFKDYDIVTDENGDAFVTFDDNLNLDVGRYVVDISSNTFKAQSAVNIITTIFAEDVIQVRGDDVEFKAQFTNNSGDFLKKSTQVQFLLDGTPCYAVIKDNEGYAVADFHSLSRGEHKVVVVNPDNGETKTYRIVILMGFAGINLGSNNQNPESQNDNPSEESPVDGNSLNGSSVSKNSSNTNSVDGNSLNGSSVSKNSSNTNSVDGNSLNGSSVSKNSLNTSSVNGNALRDNSLFFDYSSLNANNNGISNSGNHSANGPVSKSIGNPLTNGGVNNICLIILLILAIIAAGAIIKKNKS